MQISLKTSWLLFAGSESKSYFSSFYTEIWNLSTWSRNAVNASIQLKFRPGLVKSIKKSCKEGKTDGNMVWEWFFPVLLVKSNIMDFSATPCFFFSLTDLILAQSIQFRFHTCMKRQRLSLHSLESADVLTVSELMQISKLKFKLCWSFKRNPT